MALDTHYVTMTDQRSRVIDSHQIQIRDIFSTDGIVRFEGFLSKPRGYDIATAVPIEPPLPKSDVLGCLQTLGIIPITGTIPGKVYNS